MTQLIPAVFIRSALVAAATKDARYYLNGIFFDTDKNRIVGTDGSMIYVAKGVDLAGAFDTPTILERFTVPKNAEHVTIEHLKANKYEVVCHLSHGKAAPGQLVKSIDAAYPNYQAALTGLSDAIAGESIQTSATAKEKGAYVAAHPGELSPSTVLLPTAQDACLQLALLARAAKIMDFPRFDFTGRARNVYLTEAKRPDELVCVMQAKAPANDALKAWRTELS